MLPLVYYNYSQVGGNELANLVKMCNGLKTPRKRGSVVSRWTGQSGNPDDYTSSSKLKVNIDLSEEAREEREKLKGKLNDIFDPSDLEEKKMKDLVHHQHVKPEKLDQTQANI